MLRAAGRNCGSEARWSWTAASSRRGPLREAIARTKQLELAATPFRRSTVRGGTTG